MVRNLSLFAHLETFAESCEFLACVKLGEVGFQSIEALGFRENSFQVLHGQLLVQLRLDLGKFSLIWHKLGASGTYIGGAVLRCCSCSD